MIKTTKRKLLRFVLLLTIITLLVINYDYLQRLLILASFVGLNIAFAYIKKKFSSPGITKYLFGIEIVLFCTVISSVAYGSAVGAIMGALLMAVNYITEHRISKYTYVTMTLYPIIGYGAYFFNTLGITVLGIILVIIYNIIAAFLSYVVGANKRTLFVFVIVNITFNVILFTGFAPVLVGLL